MGFFAEFMESSIGRKIRVAVTGVLLIGYLCVHLSANLQALGGREHFNKTAELLESLPGLLVVELLLLTIFLWHIVAAVAVTLQNRQARPERYAAARPAGGSTLGSRTMIFSGGLLVAFLVHHVWAFR